jgi:hypothetical protein
MRLGAGQSSATLVILHIVRRVTTLSQANIWSKYVFTIYGVDEKERPVLRREIRRAQVERFLSNWRRRRWFSKPAPARTIRGGSSFGLWCKS